MSNFFSITLMLFFIMDAVGIIPTYLNLVKGLPPRKQNLIAVRELLIALGVMLIFYFIGSWFLDLLSISSSTLCITGGIIFFLIALRLIFPGSENVRGKWDGAAPFVVPIAIPLVAGPTLLAAIMIFAQEETAGKIVLASIFTAWALSTLILLLAKPIYKFMGERGLAAFERLMGLILTLFAVQMILQGIKSIISTTAAA